MKCYKLINKIPVECSFDEQMMDSERIIERTFFGEVMVSTVFLTFDHSFESNQPLLFETLVFGGEFDGLMNRYFDYDSAVEGHKVICDKVDRISIERKSKLDLLGI
jgi:hypothetical protein